MRPINRQAARALRDSSLSETFALPPQGQSRAQQRVGITKGTLFLDGQRYRRWWNLERFAAANDLELGAHETVDAFLKVLRVAQKAWPKIKEARRGPGK